MTAVAERLEHVFTRRLEELMSERRLRLSQLAQQLDISYAALHGMRVGRITPSVATLRRLTDFFGVSTDWLLGLCDERTPILADPFDQIITETIIYERPCCADCPFDESARRQIGF